MQAWQTCKKSAAVHVSAVVRAERILFVDSNNNELLIINLATVPADGILFPHLQQAVDVSRNFLSLNRRCCLIVIGHQIEGLHKTKFTLILI
jgi:hypothetical protein